MDNEKTITSEEAELLTQEEELRAKQEKDELSDEDSETLEKIDSLKDDLKERFGGEGTPEKTEIEIKSLLAQKKHFRGKFEKEKEGREKVAKELEDLKNKKDPDKKITEGDKEWKEKIDFITAKGKDYSARELEFLSTIAKGKGITLEKASETDEAKLYVEAYREKVAKDETVPEPAARTIKVGNKKLSDMSKEEIEENYPQIIEEILSRQKNKSNI